MTARHPTARSARPQRSPQRLLRQTASTIARIAGCSAAIAAALTAPAALAGGSGPAPAPGGLTIAILDLAEVPALAPPKPVSADQSAWRTSFGSERKSEPKVKGASPDSPLAAIAEADAVLIQGVHAAAPLRRLFPPRTWRLIVSRGLASASNSARGTNAGDPTITAIAIKARPDLRVTARSAGLLLEARDAPESDPAGTPPPTTATAVRLMDAGRAIWLASVALPAGCSDASGCTAREQLNAWRETKRGDGELTVIGGRTHVELAGPAPAGDTPPACAAHGIDADAPWQSVPVPAGETPPNAASGCITMIRLSSQPAAQ